MPTCTVPFALDSVMLFSICQSVTIRAGKAAAVLRSHNYTIRLHRHTFRHPECKERPVCHVTCFLPASACPETVPRADWGAAPPVSRQNLTSFPVPFVVIHHTYLPGFCNSSQACNVAMRSMQDYHQNSQQWPDIGYQWVSAGHGVSRLHNAVLPPPVHSTNSRVHNCHS